jgi:hypothetical protein
MTRWRILILVLYCNHFVKLYSLIYLEALYQVHMLLGIMKRLILRLFAASLQNKWYSCLAT